MASAKHLIDDAAEQCGWGEDTCISVLCDFIDQANRRQPNFETYLQGRVDEELQRQELDEAEDDC
jgi:hypothetical protein